MRRDVEDTRHVLNLECAGLKELCIVRRDGPLVHTHTFLKDHDAACLSRAAGLVLDRLREPCECLI